MNKTVYLDTPELTVVSCDHPCEGCQVIDEIEDRLEMARSAEDQESFNKIFNEEFLTKPCTAYYRILLGLEGDDLSDEEKA